MRVFTPIEVARHAANKYLGVLVAAKYSRVLNEFPRDRSAMGEKKLTTRALEAAAAAAEGSEGDESILLPVKGDTDIFITPGYRFRVVEHLLTNFHLPRSTLLMLVAAFGGLENIRSAYQHAISHRYRFFSYGDAMLIARGS